jgi:Spy/CpxP family protein refolding chaperone
MLKKSLCLTLFATAIILLCATPLVFAQESGSMDMMEMMHKMDDMGMMEHKSMACMFCRRGECPLMYIHMADELGLSDDQVKKLKDIINDSKKFVIQKKAEKDISRLEIDSLLDETEPDQSKIFAEVDNISKAKADIMKEHIKASIQARNVLTPEQYKQAKKSARKMICPKSMGEGFKGMEYRHRKSDDKSMPMSEEMGEM